MTSQVSSRPVAMLVIGNGWKQLMLCVVHCDVTSRSVVNLSGSLNKKVNSIARVASSTTTCEQLLGV